MVQQVRRFLFRWLAFALSLFILVEVNYPQLSPQSQLSIFSMLGLILVFLKYPVHRKFSESVFAQILDLIFAFFVIVSFGYIFIQTEPMFQGLWIDDQPLGNRAGAEQSIDYKIALIGVLLVLEATRRAIGLALPILSVIFLVYAAFGFVLPDWLFPHKGYSLERIASQVFLHSQGVFGIALKVMFTYVFLFVLFGTLLEKTGTTKYIISFTRNLFRSSIGGPAKVAIISSGMMGSLSGSAVANTATTGTFTIPMMQSSGFKPSTAAGIEAAASSGGALVPPIMGAGAYMMLEIVQPAVTYLQIVKAALIPAVLYYMSLLLVVHLHAKRFKTLVQEPDQPSFENFSKVQTGLFLTAFLSLILFLLVGYTPFRAVSLSLLLILIFSTFSLQTRISFNGVLNAMEKAAESGVSLIAAASCVGLILGVVTLTGIGTKLPSILLPLAQHNLILALFLLMISTIILGMGLPSSVCYLLMASLIGPVLSDLNLVPLSVHLFIFYFGMMSMVTPPVALAAYTAAAIAQTGIMKTGFVAFRFALVGFALPYTFTIHPELLFMSSNQGKVSLLLVIFKVLVTIFAIVPLAAAISGYWFTTLKFWQRLVLLILALIILLTQFDGIQYWLRSVSFVIIAIIGFYNWRSKSFSPSY